MVWHHVFAQSVLKEFPDVLGAIRPGMTTEAVINEFRNTVALPTTQWDALLAAADGEPIFAAHTGGHLGSYYSETRTALGQRWFNSVLLVNG